MDWVPTFGGNMFGWVPTWLLVTIVAPLLALIVFLVAYVKSHLDDEDRRDELRPPTK